MRAFLKKVYPLNILSVDELTISCQLGKQYILFEALAAMSSLGAGPVQKNKRFSVPGPKRKTSDRNVKIR